MKFTKVFKDDKMTEKMQDNMSKSDSGDVNLDKDRYFSDYEAFTENEISAITAQGIALRNGMYIDFNECSKVYAETNSFDKSLCVGERDITDLSFTFYSLPKPIMIKFIEKGRLTELFSKPNTVQRFHDLQNKIVEYGYSTFDIS